MSSETERKYYMMQLDNGHLIHEYIQGFIKKKVEEEVLCTSSRVNLIEVVQKIWDNISRKLLNSVVASMPNRMQEIITNKDEPLKY